MDSGASDQFSGSLESVQMNRWVRPQHFDEFLNTVTERFERTLGARDRSSLQKGRISGHALDFWIGVLWANGSDIDAVWDQLPSQRNVSNCVFAQVSAAVRSYQLRISPRA